MYFLRRIAIAPLLTAPYDGPYKVVARSGRVFKVLIKGKVETVTAGRVKPAHIERTPEDEQTRQSTAYSKNLRTSDGCGKKKKYCYVDTF